MAKRFSLRYEADARLPWVFREGQAYLASFERWDTAVKFLVTIGVL